MSCSGLGHRKMMGLIISGAAKNSWSAAIVLAAGACLSACASETAITSEGRVIENEPRVLAPEYTLEGFYVVAAIDGGPVESAFLNTRPAVTIDRRRIHFQSQCIFHDWAWSEDAEAVQTAAWTYSASEQPVVMCSRGLTEYEQTIIDVFSAVDDVDQDVTGNLIVKGAGHALRLDRQKAPEISLRGQ